MEGIEKHGAAEVTDAGDNKAVCGGLIHEWFRNFSRCY